MTLDEINGKCPDCGDELNPIEWGRHWNEQSEKMEEATRFACMNCGEGGFDSWFFDADGEEVEDEE